MLRVFTNLIRNALEHGQTRMDIRLRREGSELLSVFANDASGLTEEDVQHVFDRFFTADKMRTGQSTGLGPVSYTHLVCALSEASGAALGTSGSVKYVCAREETPCTAGDRGISRGPLCFLLSLIHI